MLRTAPSQPRLSRALCITRYISFAEFSRAALRKRSGIYPGVRRAGRQPAGRTLALHLLGFGATVHTVAAGAEPHKLAACLSGVASTFTTFCEQRPVLRADDEPTRQSRLALSALTQRVLITGLGPLGVPVPDRM